MNQGATIQGLLTQFFFLACLRASNKMPLVVGRVAPRAPFVAHPATARAERRALPAAGGTFILLDALSVLVTSRLRVESCYK